MPIILFAVLVILIAQVGFWKTFGAIIGAAAMVVLFIVLLGVALAIAGYLVFGRNRRSF